MKPFIVPEMTFKGHPRSTAMPSFARSLELSIRDRKIFSLYTYLHTKIAQGRSRSCDSTIQ